MVSFYLKLKYFNQNSLLSRFEKNCLLFCKYRVYIYILIGFQCHIEEEKIIFIKWTLIRVDSEGPAIKLFIKKMLMSIKCCN